MDGERDERRGTDKKARTDGEVRDERRRKGGLEGRSEEVKVDLGRE